MASWRVGWLVGLALWSAPVHAQGEAPAAPAVEVPVAPPEVAPPPQPSPPPAAARHDASDDGVPWWTGTTRYAGAYYEVGLTRGTGGYLPARGLDAVGMSGLHITENHGLMAKLIVGGLLLLGVHNTEYVGSTDNGYVHTDYYRVLSDQEVQGQLDAVHGAIQSDYTLDFNLYAPSVFPWAPGKQHGGGFRLAVSGGFELDTLDRLPIVLTVGGVIGHLSTLRTVPDPETGERETTSATFGVTACLRVPVTRYADVFLQWDLNFFSIGYLLDDASLSSPSPLTLGAYLHLTDRAYVRAEGVLGGFGVQSGKIGYQLEAGVRF
jgi:hypothetical protein